MHVVRDPRPEPLSHFPQGSVWAVQETELDLAIREADRDLYMTEVKEN